MSSPKGVCGRRLRRQDVPPWPRPIEQAARPAAQDNRSEAESAETGTESRTKWLAAISGGPSLRPWRLGVFNPTATASFG